MEQATQELDYFKEYLEFEQNFKRTEISPDEVGELIMHMTSHFIRYNIRYGAALREFSAIKASYQNQVDTKTGKPMSTSKAEILSADSEQANTYEMAKIHINNIQEIINSMKVLQKSIMQEYSNAV